MDNGDAMKDQLEMYVVRWVDSWGMSKWRPRDAIDHSPEEIVSVGWAISSTKESLTLASSMTANADQCNLVICIPKGAIVSITPIKNRGIKL